MIAWKAEIKRKRRKSGAKGKSLPSGRSKKSKASGERKKTVAQALCLRILMEREMAGRRGLTDKQKKYCRERAMGKGYGEAYLDAGYNRKPEEAKHEAYRLEHLVPSSERIQKEIARLQALAEKKALLNREQRQALLTEIALDDTEKTDNRLRAADMLNRMSGDYTDNIRSESVNKVQLSYEEKKAMLEAELRGEE